MLIISATIIVLPIVLLLGIFEWDKIFSKLQHIIIEKNQNPITVLDSNLTVELVYQGLSKPTTMAFLGLDDILVLEKDKGTVQRITQDKMWKKPLLDVNVATSQERCMCGIAISNSQDLGKTYVYLYYTETPSEDGEDKLGVAPLGNRLYRYEFVKDKLENPKLLLDLPAFPGPRHNGGVIAIGPDNYLYVTIGDVDGSFNQNGNNVRSATQNYVNSSVIDGRSGILRIGQDGNVDNALLGSSYPLNLYYAYGIRNSFGITFDPLTGKLWDTENGPAYGDEVNLVEPGFNSGYTQVQGKWTYNENPSSDNSLFNASLTEHYIQTFDGRGKYSSPEFIWQDAIGVTAINFFHSDKYGKKYLDNLFVGSFATGKLFYFELDKNRTHLVLHGGLKDMVAQGLEIKDIEFAKGFGAITDLKTGPDGYLYIVSFDKGKIFRLVSTKDNTIGR